MLRQNFGNISLTCRQVGIVKQTYYNWKAKDAYFKQLVESYDSASDLQDYIDAKVVERSKENDTVLIFLAKTKGNYVEKQEPQKLQFIDSITVKVVNGTSDRSKPDIPED